MEPVIILEWRYSPAGFFGERISRPLGATVLTIENGKVEARTPASAYDADPEVGDSCADLVGNYFRATQVVTHRKFELQGPVTSRIDEQGNRVNLDHKLVGLQIESYAGTPLHRRLADQQRFRELVVKHGANETLQVMIRAYGAAVRDPADEFIHLYEIRDALKKNFGAEDVAIAKLGGKDAEPHWGALGKLANSEPVLQGRHRGRKGISLRPATPEELANARDAALHLINAYLSYLDRP